MLFTTTVFGPIRSRRLGSSLGVNLTPNHGKICTFDCLYCEAGLNSQGPGEGLPTREAVARELEAKLKQLKADGQPLDVITFSGNGEPTVHPDFEGIIDDTLRLRDEYFPNVKVSVLCNSTLINRPGVKRALRRVDNNILKIDSALTPTIRLLDRPSDPTFTAERLISEMAEFGPQCIAQTMMLRGEHEGQTIDNTTPAEVDALIAAYRAIKPRQIMLYSIDRKTPVETLRRVDPEELRAIAARIERETSIPVSVA